MPGPEQVIPQRSGDTEVAIGQMVVDVMARRPLAHPGLPEARGVDGEMTEPVGHVTESDRATEQAGVRGRHEQGKDDHESEQQAGRQEERQRIVTVRITMVRVVPAPIHRVGAMEDPAMEQVLDEAEHEQAGQDRTERADP